MRGRWGGTGNRSSLSFSALTQGRIPEIATPVRAHHNATGKMPTNEEILAALNIDADRCIAIGEAWLKANEGK